MTLPINCQECLKDHDFTIEAFGSCITCKKNYMCPNCCHTHKCIPGKISQLILITNPQWICNLMKTLEKRKENERMD